ncbi:class I SAM-dependent methyltransferase [Lactococcus lactis]|uniref:class I SAM-dependent methyltransferase n=1 Tax=Lactococcus lactis TaxID=1358 RepID=UPI00288FA1EC|nr:class I SAM-dependent methyltransferase [Lactococcus lactis]MDT2910296.1 class I SAM-dependent methyltransferase [Lactococcus lactis]MDT2917949.1 class I SAM-dependent methyltransferase [Lactococcus lactis]MDT2937353.1 class I SAM-dependent methyltransferase [Lactococcus lactis]MDT2941664.1 class I SAM-dependent methyltransferase [Lactococcus lactis]
MKQNKYDNERFFKNYASMSRSQKGLKAAGEWSELEKLLPNFQDKKVLDLGCGCGWHCKYAVNHGAKEVVGIDLSHKMLEVALDINNDKKITYQQSAIEDINFPADTFDVVFSSLAFHYISNFEDLVCKISKCLKKNGEFIFSVEHPLYTSSGKREVNFLGEPIIKYHRTLTGYINSLLSSGFELTNVIEPKPPIEMRELEEMKNEMRRPMMLLISTRNKKS